MRAAFPLLRDVAGLKSQHFDLLVIGGGIYGAWTACDAAQRGLSVALIEKTDWGSGTSQSSSKLIHGGLRYLEHYELKLVRHALGERRVLSEIAPHLVRPLNFLVPVWRDSRVGRMQLLAGLTLYDFLATGKQPVPRHKAYSREAMLRQHPYLLAPGFKGGLRYGDCQEDDARMTLVVAAAAQAAGAVCANGIAALGLIERDGRIVGARLCDGETGERFEVQARVTVNAAGPWASALCSDALGEASPKVKLVKGIHLVLPNIPGLQDAFLLTAPSDGRVFFLIPWYGKTLLGTTEAGIADPAQTLVTAEESRYLLAAVNALMPGLVWSEKDVIASFAGARSLQAEDAESLAAQTREFVVTAPKPGLLWPIGGKFTTGRCDAEEVVEQVYKMLDRPAPSSRTHLLPLPGAPGGLHEGSDRESTLLGDFTGWQAEALPALMARGVDAEAAHWLSQRHGTRLSAIHALLSENPAWSARITPEAPFIEAEALLAVREENARSLDDICRRRMPLSLLARPGIWRERVAALTGLNR